MIEVNDRLCYTCRAIFSTSAEPHRSTEQSRFPAKHHHHLDLQSFRTALDAGCFICSVFQEPQGAEYTETSPVEEQEPFSTYYLVGRDQGPGIYMLSVQINNLHAASSNIKPSYHVFEIVKVDENVISLNTPSTQRLDLLSQWATDCCRQSNNATHTVCQHYRETARNLKLQKPSRLLEIGTGHWQGFVRLTSLGPAKSSSFPDYVTLGTLPSASDGTPSSSLLSSVENNWLPVKGLPQMIQDALTLTKDVGAHYLWISDLSEEENITTEHSHRGEIIAGALFHIAPAFYTLTNDEGILPRAASPNNNPSVPVVIPTWAPGSAKFAILDPDTMTKSLAPSTSNAQAYHDNFIAPAILYCTTSQIWWQCRGGSYSETFPTGVGNGSPLPSVRVGMHNLHPVSSVFRNLDDSLPIAGGTTWPFVDRLTSLWTQVASAFSAASYQEDRLLLLESMATHLRDLAYPYQPAFKTTVYRAGLWFPAGGSGVHQLLWHATAPRQTLTEPVSGKRVSAVPTWSWASSTAPAEYSFYLAHQMGMFSLTPAIWPGTMLDDTVAEVTQVDETVLTLRGRLIPLEINQDDNRGSGSFSAVFPYAGKATARLVFDVAEEEVLATEHCGQSGRYFALPLTLKTAEPPRFAMQGLVLRPHHHATDDGNDGGNNDGRIYTRCGWFRCDSGPNFQGEWKEVDIVEDFGLSLEKYGEAIVLV